MSGSIRLYVDASLCEGAEFSASAAHTHYLGTVMRRRVGDTILVFNGRDGEYAAEISAFGRDGARLAVRRQTRPQAPEPDLWLVFALLKRDATDLVVQKATELGAAAILPVFTDHANAARANVDRLRAIGIEAAEQSERLTVPTIIIPRPLAAVLADWPAGRTLHAAIERRAAPAIIPTVTATALLIGPEGGFSAAELDALGRHKSVVPISLGPRILRAETAAIAGLALLQANAPR